MIQIGRLFRTVKLQNSEILKDYDREMSTNLFVSHRTNNGFFVC